MLFPLHEGPEKLAEIFHRTYENLAPMFNYNTRKASAVPWEKVPEQNKKLMIAVATIIQSLLHDEQERRDFYLIEYWKIIFKEQIKASFDFKEAGARMQREYEEENMN